MTGRRGDQPDGMRGAVMFTLSAALVLAAQTAVQAPPAAAPSPAAAAGPVVVLSTSLGRIVVGLDKAKAPITVANFIKYVRGGHYDHTIFHRVIPAFMIQGGGYEEDLSEHPTRPPIKNESLNGLSNRRGTIAMARTTAPDSATAQFYINLKDNLQLDGRPGRPGYTVFGEVLEGMEVVDRIAATPTQAKGRAFANLPVKAIVIRSVREAPGWKPAPTPPPPPAAPPASTVEGPEVDAPQAEPSRAREATPAP
jgi:peptidyl-prolyl cis-trans isomerase A (cyclophilin A)